MRFASALTLLMAVSPGICGLSACGARRPGDGAAAAPAKARLRGRVVTPKGEPPRAGRVRLGADPADGRVPLADVLLGPDGAFDVKGLPPGRLRLEAWAAGFSPAAVSLLLRAGEDLASIVRLAAAHDLRGTVRDRRGQPVPFATVAVLPAGASDDVGQQVRADESGAFTVSGLPAGKASVRASATGLGSLVVPSVDVPSPPAVLVIDGEGRSLLGSVFVGGAPAEGARVSVGAAGQRREVRAGGDGRFAVHGLGAGRYTVRAVRGGLAASAQVTIPEKAVAAVPPSRLELRPASTVNVRVVDEQGFPLPDTDVTLTPNPDDGLGAADKTEAHGHVAFGALPGGEYRLDARRDGFILLTSPQFAIAVGAGETGNRDETLILARAGRVRGMVVDQTGAPLAGAGVRLADALPPAAADGNVSVVRGQLPLAADAARRASHTRPTAGAASVRAATSDAAGRFELGTVPGGTFALDVTHPQALAERRAGIIVVAGRDTDVGTVTLRAGFRVPGRVLDAAGDPIQGARIAAVAGAEATASSDARGEFELQLPAGPQRLSVSAPEHEMASVTVEVAGTVAPVEVRLSRADAVVAGSVRDSNGRVLRGVRVSVFGGAPTAALPGAALPVPVPSSEAALASVTTDALGRFRMAHLPRGPLVLEARHADYPVLRQVAVAGAPLDLRLPFPGGIAGDVREKGNGAFVARYRLAASGPDGRVETPRTAGAGFEVLRLVPGRWLLTVDAPGFRRETVTVDVPPAPALNLPSVRDLRLNLERSP